MLRVQFELADRDIESPVRVSEGRGWVQYELHRGLFLPEGVAALNASVTQILAGGQWFQLWRGEIVSIYSPEEPQNGADAHGRVHRGPLAHQAAGREHR